MLDKINNLIIEYEKELNDLLWEQLELELDDNVDKSSDIYFSYLDTFHTHVDDLESFISELEMLRDYYIGDVD